jgi:hypothetical protein
MKTWDDVKKLYYHIAWGLCRRFKQYEPDELVDEAYIPTYFLWDWDISKLTMRIYQRMMDYIRHEARRNRVGSGQNLKNLRVINEQSLENMGFDIPVNLKDEVEVQEYIETKSKILTLEEKILLVLKYDYDVPLFRIGELFNYYDSEAGRRHKNILKKMRLSMKETEQLICEQITEGIVL